MTTDTGHMSDNLQLKIIALDRVLYDADIKQANITTTGGEMTLLKGHMPIAAILEDAPVIIVDMQDHEEIVAVHGGYMSVFENELLIVADDAIFASEIDDAIIREDIQRNQAIIDKGEADALSINRAEVHIKRNIMNLKINEMLKKK